MIINIFLNYRLSDIEDLPSLCVQRHQPGSDEVSSPGLHSAVQHFVQIHLDTHKTKIKLLFLFPWFGCCSLGFLECR